MTRTFKPAITQKTITHEKNRFIDSGRRLSVPDWKFKEIFRPSRRDSRFRDMDAAAGFRLIYQSLGFGLTAVCGERLMRG